MIDLHIHSKYSPDGCTEINDLLKEAEILDLKYISITDHNTCEAYNNLNNQEIRKIYTGKIIPGVELNTEVLEIPIEILGYNINPIKLQKLINQTYLSNIERNKIEIQRLYEKAIKAEIKLPNNFIKNYDGTIYGSKYFHSYIIKNETNKKILSEASWKDSNIFYREYMSNPTSIFYINMDDILPKFEVAADIIHEANGIVFLPHIFEYRENAKKILNHILKNYQFEGIECYYRNFSTEQTNYLLNICKENNLFISGGSDYHGKEKPHIKMGTGEGNLFVPDNIVNNWKKNII